jgi:hypothetical protein
MAERFGAIAGYIGISLRELETTNVIYAQAEYSGGDRLLDRQRLPSRARNYETRPWQNNRTAALSAAAFWTRSPIIKARLSRPIRRSTPHWTIAFPHPIRPTSLQAESRMTSPNKADALG